MRKKVLYFFLILSFTYSKAQVFIPFTFWAAHQKISLAKSIVTINLSQVSVSNTATITFTTKNDQNMNINLSGHAVVFSLSGAGTSSGTIGAVTDNLNGTYSATFTAVTIGTARNISATIDGNPITSTPPTVTVIGISCVQVLAQGFATSQVYAIDSDGTGFGVTPYNVYCDQTNDTGGWMLTAVPRRAVAKMSETVGLIDPTQLTNGRNANIWSTTSTVPFTQIRFTDNWPATTNKNIATFGSSQNFSALMTTYAAYSRTNIVLSGASVTSNIGSTCFLIRAKSDNFTPYNDSADWLWMGFHSSCTSPLTYGDTWDTGSGSTQWLVGGKDNGDGMLLDTSVGINTSNKHWNFNNTATYDIDTRTMVWVK
jgi:hypothetical protein